MTTDDMRLVREYAAHQSESAFAALVERHTNLVYSAALRQVCHPQLAEEITQIVFILLARKAGSLGDKVILTGWLYRTACYASASMLKRERRRQSREQEAYMQSERDSPSDVTWSQMSPLLDEAMLRLGQTDRDALVLRFFEGRNLQEVGSALGASEEAAKKRVSRALDKLRDFFAQRGVDSTTAAIAENISAHSIQAAPAGLAATIAAGVISGTTTTTAAVAAATKAITMTTFQKAIVTGALLVTAGAGIFETHQAAQLRAQNQTLRQQQASSTAQVQQLSQSLADTSNQLANLLAENAQLKSNFSQRELMKLRGEVTQLKIANAQSDSNDPTDVAAKDVAARVKQMKQWLEQNPNEKIPELQYLTAQQWLRAANYSRDLETDDEIDRAVSQLRREAKRTFAYSLGDALASYLAGNNGQLPGDISQLEPYFNPPVDATVLQRYQLLLTGNLSDIPKAEPLIAEKAPVDDQYDSLFKISATGYSYQGTGTAWVNGSGNGSFGTNITEKIKPFERPN